MERIWWATSARRPHRRRIDTPTLRGVNIQRLFGSQRALRSVEDFTEFEQRAAYFDGDPVIATKKGVNPLERGSQVHFMAELQELFDFPPAPKLNLYGRLDPSKASQAELRGEALFFGKANCAVCHIPPFYTDNLMHNLKVERFYKPQWVNGMVATAQGPIKTFPLRGIKESPPYLHDGQAADARRRGGVLQSDPGVEAEQGGEGRSGRLPAGALRRNLGSYTLKLGLGADCNCMYGKADRISTASGSAMRLRQGNCLAW